jgi:hypothetical protein
MNKNKFLIEDVDHKRVGELQWAVEYFEQLDLGQQDLSICFTTSDAF